MTHNPKEFWEKRKKKYSHTGWSDPIIYGYDQEERLSVVSSCLDSLNFSSKTALDFGCGTGDFAALLLEKGFKVWATDPYIKPKLSNEALTFASYLNELTIPDRFLSLILSVTVLDHIVDRNLLQKTLDFFKKKLSHDGHFVMVEYALEENCNQPEKNEYQSFRTLKDWKEILSLRGFKIKSVFSLPHPLSCPSVGYSSYRDNIIVRGVSRLTRKRLVNAGKLFLPALRQHARNVLGKHPVSKQSFNGSPLKLLVCIHK